MSPGMLENVSVQLPTKSYVMRWLHSGAYQIKSKPMRYRFTFLVTKVYAAALQVYSLASSNLTTYETNIAEVVAIGLPFGITCVASQCGNKRTRFMKFSFMSASSDGRIGTACVQCPLPIQHTHTSMSTICLSNQIPNTRCPDQLETRQNVHAESQANRRLDSPAPQR